MRGKGGTRINGAALSRKSDRNQIQTVVGGGQGGRRRLILVFRTNQREKGSGEKKPSDGRSLRKLDTQKKQKKL